MKYLVWYAYRGHYRETITYKWQSTIFEVGTIRAARNALPQPDRYFLFLTKHN